MHSLNGRWLSCLLAILVLPALSGCVAKSVLVSKQREASELIYQNERMRDTLGERLNEIEQLRRAQQRGESVHRDLEASRSELETSLRFANEQVKTLTGQRSELKTQVEDAEAARRQSEQSLRRVQEVASSSAGELAELRVRSREFEERVGDLANRNESLAQQNSAMDAELDKVQSELVRQKAVVRSFREGTQVQAVSEEAGRVQERLQHENADLRGEKVALEKRIEQLEKKASSTRAAAVATAVATEGPFYQRDPEGLFGEVRSLLAVRLEAAKQGIVAWDLFDVAVCGVVAVVVLALLFFLLRTLRIGRLKGEVRNLRMAVSEFEESLENDAPRRASPPASADTPAAPRPVRNVGSPRRGFSAVISSPTAAAPAVAATATATAEGEGSDDPFDQLEADGGDASGAEKGPRRVIGAGVWEDTGTVSLPDPQSTAVMPPIEDEPEEDAMANTQIMPSFTELELGTGSPGISDSEDKEILTELKSVINKKFDELLK